MPAKYIYVGPEAKSTRLNGQHLKHMAVNAKESAAGMDQWTPGDFRLLSDLAYEHLAELMNCIEDTGKLPKKLSETHAKHGPTKASDKLPDKIFFA